MEPTKNFSITNEMLASNWQRFGNYSIDIIIHYAIIFTLAIVIGIIATALGNTSFLYWMENISDLESYLIYFAVMIPYYMLFETYTSRTLAKYITKTMVVTQDGSKPDLGISFKRTMSRIIPFDAISFLGSSGRGWHDSISDTYVVKKDVFEKEKELFYSLDEIGNLTE